MTVADLERSDGGEPASLEGVLQDTLNTLDAEEQRLMARHAALTDALSNLDAELRRIDSVRQAILGRPVARSKPKPAASGAQTTREKAQANREAVLRFAREHGGWFTAGEAGQALGRSGQGLGPLLRALERRGEAESRNTGKQPEFRVRT